MRLYYVEHAGEPVGEKAFHTYDEAYLELRRIADTWYHAALNNGDDSFDGTSDCYVHELRVNDFIQPDAYVAGKK